MSSGKVIAANKSVSNADVHLERAEQRQTEQEPLVVSHPATKSHILDSLAGESVEQHCAEKFM